MHAATAAVCSPHYPDVMSLFGGLYYRTAFCNCRSRILCSICTWFLLTPWRWRNTSRTPRCSLISCTGTRILLGGIKEGLTKIKLKFKIFFFIISGLLKATRTRQICASRGSRTWQGNIQKEETTQRPRTVLSTAPPWLQNTSTCWRTVATCRLVVSHFRWVRVCLLNI